MPSQLTALLSTHNTCIFQLKKGDKKTIDLMIDFTSCFMIFLREDSCRKFVNEGYNLDRHLSAFLGHALTVGNVQLLYQVGGHS